MGLFNNDDELRDANGHLPNTPGRNYAAGCALAAFVGAVAGIVGIIWHFFASGY